MGDVFLHLLPEAWSSDFDSKDPHCKKYITPTKNVVFIKSSFDSAHPSLRSGLWVLAGILIFTIVEKIFSGYVNADEENPQPRCIEIANCLMKRSGGKVPDDGKNGLSCTPNGSCDIEDVPNGCFLADKGKKKEQPKKVAGYLNLMANSIDNFTHGLAVAGSFLVSFRHGVLATFAILRRFLCINFNQKTVFKLIANTSSPRDST